MWKMVDFRWIFIVLAEYQIHELCKRWSRRRYISWIKWMTDLSDSVECDKDRFTIQHRTRRQIMEFVNFWFTVQFTPTPSHIRYDYSMHSTREGWWYLSYCCAWTIHCNWDIWFSMATLSASSTDNAALLVTFSTQ